MPYTCRVCAERLGPLGRLAVASPQALVLGMHRSGTSALTSLLDRLGFYAGPDESLMPADEHNARGYWELGELQDLNEQLLAALGGNWTDVLGVDPRRLGEEARDSFRARARSLVSHLDSYGPWVIKDPRLCLLLPFWREMLDRPVCVLIHRHPLAVARSLAKRDGLPIHVGIALWEHYNLAALAGSLGLPRALVGYHELLMEPAGMASKLIRTLQAVGVEGLGALRGLSPHDARALLDSSLEHHAASPEEERGFLNDAQRELLQSLESGAALLQPVPPLSAGAREVLREHACYSQALARERSLAEDLHRVEGMLAEAWEALEPLEGLERERAALAGKLARERQAVEQREALLGAVFSSRSWRLGFGLVRLFGRKAPSALDRWKSLSDP